MLSHAQTKRDRGVGSAPLRGGAAVCPRRVPGRGRPSSRGDRGRGASMVPVVARQGQGRIEGRRPLGAQAKPGRRAVGPARCDSPPGAPDPGGCHRSLDAAADGHGPRAADRGPTPSGPRVAAAAEVELVAPTPRAADPRTGRAGDSAGGPAPLAAGKKTPAVGAPGLSSRTRAGSRRSRSSATRGHPGTRPRS